MSTGGEGGGRGREGGEREGERIRREGEVDSSLIVLCVKSYKG